MRRLTALLVLETVATVVLAAVAPVFVGDGRAGDPIAAAAWVAALGVSGWLLVSTVCCAALELVPRAPARLHAVVRRVTHPAVRAAIAGGLAFGSPIVTGSGALAADTTSTSSTIRTGRDITVVEPEPPAAPTSPPAPAAPPTSPSTDHRVVPGDNLWAIATARLATHLERRPTEPEVARYWAVVVDLNRARVRSGDPDLIFPGELIALPPL